MITLPSGVNLRDFNDTDTTRSEIFRRVQESLHSKFPLENDKIKIELLNSEYDKNKLKHSLEDYQNAILKGGRLSTPLRGTVRLTDKLTNTALDEKNIVLANVPYLTSDGTYVLGGNHYVNSNQLRLKPGIYARRKDNGELESHFNAKPGTGPSMRLYMEPKTGIYRVGIGQSTIKLYPILKGLGVSDKEIESNWGEDIANLNKSAFDSKAFNKFYHKMAGSRADDLLSTEDKSKDIKDRLIKMEFDPEVNNRTLGHPHNNADVPTLFAATNKLLRINKGKDTTDDRDSLINKSIHSTEDFMSERIKKDSGGLFRNLLYKTTYNRTLKGLSPGYWTPALEGLLIGNSLSSPLPGINPLEAYGQNRRVVQTGDGGIASANAISDSARNVSPSQLGMVDPIMSSESTNIGVDQRLTSTAMKGSDNEIYMPVKNKKTGKINYMNSTQLHGKVIAFPKGHDLEKYKTNPLSVTDTIK